jgi:hypothetical protein
MRPPWLETCRFGARLQHPHSQIIAIRLIPARCVNRPYEALRLWLMPENAYFAIWWSARLRTRLALSSKVRSSSPYEVFASPAPFATHILPLHRMATFGEITVAEIVDLARVLRNLSARIYVENPQLNLTVRSGPSDGVGARHFHRYVGSSRVSAARPASNWAPGCPATQFCPRQRLNFLARWLGEKRWERPAPLVGIGGWKGSRKPGSKTGN